MMKPLLSAGLVMAGLMMAAWGEPAAEAKPQSPAAAGKPAAPVTQKGVWTVSDWSEWKQQDTGPEARISIVPELPGKDPAGGGVPLSAEAEKAGVLVLERGEPFTVVRYGGPQEIPVDEYEISWEGMRVEGNDFFAALTFPVGAPDRCATFVTGGWGGWTVGVSSIQHQFANENETTGSMEFKLGQWYAFTLQVNRECLRGLIDGKEQFKVGLKGKTISMHPSEISKSAPLGFTSYSTRGAVRNVRIRALKPGELTPPVTPE